MNAEARKKLKEKVAVKQKPVPPKPKPVAEQVVYKCKHTVGAVHFLTMECPPCRDARRKGKARAGREHASFKANVPTNRDGRLPDGAEFKAKYDEAATMWVGSLTFQVNDAEAVVFDGRCSSVEKLLRSLAKQCWEWLTAKRKSSFATE